MTNITPFILAIYKVLLFLVFTINGYYVIILYMDTKAIKIVGTKGELLEAYIPKLKSFQSRRGAEGVAFYVGKEFIVKYFERVNLEYSLFDNYCNEIKSFGDSGLAYPKVYSWATSPICVEDDVYRYYILQQQVPGKELYPYSMCDLEDKCLTFCSRREFDETLKDIKNHKTLYNKMLETFSKAYLETNEQLEALSREEFGRFIKTYFEINRKSKFVSPDLHPGNVIFDGEHLMMIDGSMCYRTNSWLDYNGNFKEKYFKVESFFDILALFSCNKHISIYLDHYLDDVGEMPSKKLLKICDDNKKLMTEIFHKCIAECKELVVPSTLTELDVDYLYGQVNGLLTKKGEKTIMRALQK